MRWLLILWMMTLKGKADSQTSGLVLEILNEEDFHHCSFLQMMNFVSQLTENQMLIHENHLNDTEDYLSVFHIPYKRVNEEDGEEKEVPEDSHFDDLWHNIRQRRDVVHAIPTIECNIPYCPEPKINDWMSYDEITAFVLTINNTFVNRVFTKSIGVTKEGRHIWQVRIRRGPCDEDKNFFLEAGSQAREWIAPAVAVNFIWRLIYECLMAPGYSFYIVPLLNPDGYEYSRTTDPTWIKNRANTTNENCTGVNINRNYSYKWGTSGSSLMPCSEVYNGGKPFSEIESQSLQKSCSECANITMLMSFSASYKVGGESILYPWSYTQSSVPENVNMLQHYAQIFEDAAYQIHGVNYTVEQASFRYFSHSGTVMDWVMGVQNATAAFTVQLRGDGSYNHENPSIIQPAVEESWAGFDALIQQITSDNE